MASAVNRDGYREILGICEGAKEDKSGWSSFLRHLVDRGLKGAQLVRAIILLKARRERPHKTLQRKSSRRHSTPARATPSRQSNACGASGGLLRRLRGDINAYPPWFWK
nr:transposase [uncultured Cohaesibacter sp.]